MTVVALVERASKMESESLVTVTLQVPADVNERSVPTTEHDADPVSETEYVSSPDPEPPLCVREIGVP